MSTLPSCPNCGHEIDCNTDMIGMPAGLKFDPSDQELIHHLQTMVDEGGSRAHPLIDEFIPTIRGENGICYTHPENLPGVRRDGMSKHFFHRSSKAYTNGTRKRRKIHAQHDGNNNSDDKNVAEMRWHKTGKTRPVIVDGRQTGCKKILVLYTNFGKNRKPEKTNWVMHQYHLGDQEERDGELVVSKIFYQTQTRQHVGAAMAATAEPSSMMNVERAVKTSEAMQAGIDTTSSVVRMQQLQQQPRTKQGDGQCVVALSNKRCHEVGIGDQETSDQGLLDNDNHGIPSQHEVRFYVHGLLNNASTVISSPAVGNASIVFNRRFPSPTSFPRNEKFEEEHGQKEVGRTISAGLEEMIKGASSAQSETRRPYRCWPPDRIQDQHG